MRVVALGALLAIATVPARAGLPDWAKEIAEAAPTVGDEMPEWPSRVLFEETRIVVAPDGVTWRINRREAVQYLSNRVDDTAFGFFTFDDTTKVKKAKGWHVAPGERAQRNAGGAADLAIGDAFLTDAKARFVALDGVKRGSLVFYEFDAESHPYTLTDREIFGGPTPIASARLNVELPPDWTLRYAWLPGAGPEPARAGSSWTFERKDWVPVKRVELGEAPSALWPRLVFATLPPQGATAAGRAMSDWDALARWYEDLAHGRDAASPEITAAAAQALAKAGPERMAKVRAAALLVRDRVRYVAREVGIGGYQPRPATQVFSELYGDCKDKGTLFSAVLSAGGIPSYPILIHATDPSTVADTVADPGSFNHFVVGIPWPEDTPVPDDAAGAIADAGALGKLLVVDTTDEYAWPGQLPAELAGKKGLVIAGHRGVLVTMPRGSPREHRVAYKLDLSLDAKHAAAATFESRYFGALAEEARAENAASSVDRRKSVERAILSKFPGATIKTYKALPEDGDGAYVQTVAFDVPAGSAFPGLGVPMFAGASEVLQRVPLSKRDQPVVFPYPVGVRYESSVRGAAANAALPVPLAVSGDGWSVASQFDRQGDAIHGVWSVDLSRTRFEPAAFPELKQFWSNASKAAGPLIPVE